MKGTNIHGIIGNALRKYGLKGFILVIYLVSDPGLVLALEQAYLTAVPVPTISPPTAASCVGVKRSEEEKAKMSTARKGNNYLKGRKGYKQSDEHKANNAASRYNGGKPVYLYVVHTHGLELSSMHLNSYRLVEFLGVPYSTLYRYIKHRTLFKVNGISYIASRDGNLS